MGTSFAVNHIGMAVIQPGEKLDFLARQVRTSRNIRGGFWASPLLGGLNYQIEHHLFPNMARPRLHAARALVRAHCAALDITYTEVHLGQAHAAVAREIRRVGLAARSQYRCPVVAGYRAF